MNDQEQYITFLKDALNTFQTTYPTYPQKFIHILKHLEVEEGETPYVDVFGTLPATNEVSALPETLINLLNSENENFQAITRLSELFILDQLTIGVRKKDISPSDAKFYIEKMPIAVIAYMSHIR